MSLEILIWVALAVLLVMGTPIFVSLGMASITVLLLSDIPLSLVMIDLIKVSTCSPCWRWWASSSPPFLA